MATKLIYLDKNTHWTLDRFEGDFGVLENAQTLETLPLPLGELPKGMTPGQTMRYVGHAWAVDDQATAQRGERIRGLFEKIKRSN